VLDATKLRITLVGPASSASTGSGWRRVAIHVSQAGHSFPNFPVFLPHDGHNIVSPHTSAAEFSAATSIVSDRLLLAHFVPLWYDCGGGNEWVIPQAATGPGVSAPGYFVAGDPDPAKAGGSRSPWISPSGNLPAVSILMEASGFLQFSLVGVDGLPTDTDCVRGLGRAGVWMIVKVV